MAPNHGALLFSFLLEAVLVHSTISNNGTTTTTFVTLEPLETVNYSLYGEGMAYDTERDRFILGSLQLGTLISVPRSTLSEGSVSFDTADITFLLSERPASFNGSNFLGLEMDPHNSNTLWGCVSYGDYHTYGVAKINLSTNFVEFFDMSHLANPETGSHAVFNDLTLDSRGQYLYITDTWGYQVLRMDVSSGSTEVWGNGTAYCTDCLSTEPHYDGPNGIALACVTHMGHVPESCYQECDRNDEFLLIALGASSNTLLKVNTSMPFIEPDAILVNNNAGYLESMDAIALSSDHTTLYVLGNGVNSLFALTSSDNWVTATLRATYNAACPKFQPSALSIVRGRDITVYCTNGFGAAPYPLTTLTNAFERVNAVHGLQLNIYNMVGEGIEYDGGVKDRLIVGSTSTGSIRGIPNTDFIGVKHSDLDTHEYFSGGGSIPITSVKGLKIDPSDRCLLWVAVSSTPIGVALFDICSSYYSSEPSTFVNLSSYGNPSYGSSPNDIAVHESILYVTDFQGGYLWSIRNPTYSSTAYVSIFKKFEVSSHPNGIETTGDLLLVSLSATGSLWVYNLKTGKQYFVDIQYPASTMNLNGDGLRFDANHEVLYVARHSYDSVIALVSCDEWRTAYLATDFSANCFSTLGSPSVTTLAMAGSNLWVFCSNDFGTGPYSINRIQNASGQVYSGNTACLPTDTEDSVGSGHSHNDDSVVQQPLFWSTLFLAISLATVLCSIYYVTLYHSLNGESDTTTSSLIQGT